MKFALPIATVVVGFCLLFINVYVSVLGALAMVAFGVGVLIDRIEGMEKKSDSTENGNKQD